MRAGFIGLGRMGRRMATRLVDAGFDLSVYDAMPSKAASLAGARAVSSPGDFMEVDVVVSGVTDGPAVLSALESLLAQPRRGLLLIETTTIGLQDSRRVAAVCEAGGVRYVRSALLGTLDAAASGKLTALVSGPLDAAEAARPVLAHVCAEQVYVGAAEEGRVMKLLINGLLGAGLAAFAEALAIGQKAGLDVPRLLEVIGASAMASPALKGSAQALARNRDFEPRLTAALLTKDLRLLNELAADSGTPAPVAASILQLYEATVNLGWGEKDTSAVVLLYEKLAGLG